MEGDFRNLTSKVWGNLDNPIKRYYFSKVSLILLKFHEEKKFPLLLYLGMLGLR